MTLLLLLLVLAAGGWGAWRYVLGNNGGLPPSMAAKLTDANVDGPPIPRPMRQRPPNFGQFAARFAANMPDGIVPTGRAYLIKSGTARLNVDPGNGNNIRGEWRYRFSYAIPDIESPEEMRTLQAVRRVLNDPSAAQKMGVSQEQLQQLRTLGGIGMAVRPADRTRIIALFQAWLTASGRSTPSADSVPLPPLSAS